MKNKKITMSIYIFATVSIMALIAGLLLSPILSQPDGLVSMKITVNYADGTSEVYEPEPSILDMFKPPSLTIYNMAGTEITGIAVDVTATPTYSGGNGLSSWSWSGDTEVSHQSLRISAPGSSTKTLKQTVDHDYVGTASSGSIILLKSFSISASTLEGWVSSSYKGFDYEQWCYFDASASVTINFNDGSTDSRSASATAYIKYQVEPSGSVTGLTIYIQDGYMY